MSVVIFSCSDQKSCLSLPFATFPSKFLLILTPRASSGHPVLFNAALFQRFSFPILQVLLKASPLWRPYCLRVFSTHRIAVDGVLQFSCVMLQVLLKAFLPNVKSSSATCRRTAAASLTLICQECRKPPTFFAWLLNTLLSKSQSTLDKLVGNSFDAACIHFHSQQQVQFACVCTSVFSLDRAQGLFVLSGLSDGQHSGSLTCVTG